MAKGELQKNMKTEFSPSFDNRNRKVVYMETFGRLMAGIAPWLALPDDDDTAEGKMRRQLREWALAAYKHSVDPQSPDYLCWGVSGPEPRRRRLHRRVVHPCLRRPVGAARPDDQAALHQGVQEAAQHRAALHQLVPLLVDHRELHRQGRRPEGVRRLPRDDDHPQGRGVVRGRRLVCRRPRLRLRLLLELRLPRHVLGDAAEHDRRQGQHPPGVPEVLRPRPEACAEVLHHPRALHLARGHLPRHRPLHALPSGRHAAAGPDGVVPEAAQGPEQRTGARRPDRR